MADGTVQRLPGTPGAGSAKQILDQAVQAMAAGEPQLAEALTDAAVLSGSTHPGLMRIWIQSAWRQDKIAVARERAEKTIAAHPRNPEFNLLAARLQIAAGEPHAALARLEQAVAAWPDHVGLRLQLLQLLKDLGRRGPALRVLGGLRRNWPDHAEVLLAASQLYRTRGRTRAADALLERLLARHPEHRQARVLLQLEQARQALAAGDLDGAEALASAAVQSGSNHPGVLRIGIHAASRQGHVATARARAEQAIAAHPRNPDFRILAARLEAAAGEPRQALARLEAALAQWPDNLGLNLYLFELLQELGSTRQALRVLRDLRRRWPDQADVLLAAARMYHEHGKTRAARAVLDRLLARDPAHAQARLARLDLASAAAASEAPSPLPALLEEARSQPAPSTAEVALLLKTIEQATAPELAAVREAAIDFLGSMSGRLAGQHNLALFNLAERFGRAEAARQALARLLDEGPRSVQVARTLFRKAMDSVGPHQADCVISRLLRHIPAAQQATLAADFALHLDGPEAALERLRRDRRRNRAPGEALNLVRLLKFAGRYALGLRYLQFCRRRWPDNAEIRLNQATLLMEAGRPDLALAGLDEPVAVSRRKQAQFARIRAHALLETGQWHAALAELDKAAASRLDHGVAATRLRVLLMLGREEEAAAQVREARRRGVQDRISSEHFSLSLYGTLMGDLALFRAESASLPPGDHSGYLAARYICAASQIIERHAGNADDHVRNAAHDGAPAIPRRIFQYWNLRVPPESVAEIMRSWSRLPDVEYVRFDRAAARRFLRETYGPDYELAFRLANNIAEEADFLRLCYLRHHGGIYADADDRLYGTLAELVPAGAGLVCFREPFGILANNCIAARPGHPAIVRASEMAAEALLSRDNDSTWSKTGPGLLSRAVASYLAAARPAEPGDRVVIRPNHVLRRQVQIHIQLPHKKTRKYWNAANTTGIDMKPFFMPPCRKAA